MPTVLEFPDVQNPDVQPFAPDPSIPPGPLEPEPDPDPFVPTPTSNNRRRASSPVGKGITPGPINNVTPTEECAGWSVAGSKCNPTPVPTPKPDPTTPTTPTPVPTPATDPIDRIADVLGNILGQPISIPGGGASPTVVPSQDVSSGSNNTAIFIIAAGLAVVAYVYLKRKHGGAT